MTSQELCDILDARQLSTREAAKRMGIAEVTLQMWCRGQRYPSHGGKVIITLPRRVEKLIKLL